MWLFFLWNNSIFGVSLDRLIGPDILTEIKTRAAGSARPLKVFKKLILFPLTATGNGIYYIMSYHPESTRASYF